MDTHTSSRRALKLAQEQEVAEDRRQTTGTRQSSTCCRDFGTKERESKGREDILGTLFKLLVKDKLFYNGKVPVNAELRPPRRERRGTEVQRYGTLNEVMKMSQTILHRTATQLLLPPHTSYYSITLFESYDPVKLQHQNKPLLNCITKPGKLNTE